MIAGVSKEKIFAYWYFWSRDVDIAARKAGVESIWELSLRKVRTEWKKLSNLFAQQSPAELAKLGLYQILFSRVSLDPEGRISPDSFLTTRYSEGKGVEYQFYDKLKACELLMRLEEQSKSERKEDGFYSILEALRCGEKEEGERKEELTEGEDI